MKDSGLEPSMGEMLQPLSGDELPREALLGLATTKELLTEIECRMRIGASIESYPNTYYMGNLEDACQVAMDLLPEKVLNYRTVDES